MKKIFGLLIMIAATANVSFAVGMGGFDAGAINSQNMRDLRTHEAIVRSKNKSAIVSTKTMPKPQQEIAVSNINSIIFVNNHSISSDELNVVVQDKMNQPMTIENISDIRKDIMKYYQSRGFFSAIVMVVSRDFQKGELVLDVKEGGRNSISIQE